MTPGDIVLPGDYDTPLFQAPVEPTADTGLTKSLAVNRVRAVFLGLA